jgi:hypothetical protein
VTSKINLLPQFFINRPEGLLPFKPEHAGVPLPWGLDVAGSALTYGPYFHALASFLRQDDDQPICLALSQYLERPVRRKEIQRLEIISQKHGAFYHVAQISLRVSGRDCSLVVNSAVGREQQSILESEFALLRDLHQRRPLGLIPRAYVLGDSSFGAEGGLRLNMKSFIGEWFEGYHEFHLSPGDEEEPPMIRAWDGRSEKSFLNVEEMQSLYHQAASILTAYFDPESWSQIYPWHHAAGDFVVKRQKQRVELRLITVRGYLPLVAVGSDPSEQWIPIVHFFLNLSLRMRLDRLDGTGELVWARPDCLRGVVSGFLEAWNKKSAMDSVLPEASQVAEVLRSFAPEEWLSVAEVVMADGLMEDGEMEFILPRLQEHVVSLCSALCYDSV